MPIKARSGSGKRRGSFKDHLFLILTMKQFYNGLDFYFKHIWISKLVSYY